ncbi:hypothetical protein B0H14DRAFT_2564749 [Mycena olivaceomarginata]|nr:hypothetical protein B0H14DRAFT_2564749 [Mycena olivaceomarginata]
MGQEEKSATDRARLFKGKAQCLSSDEFFQAVGEIETNRSAREAGKEAKKVERQRMKEARDEIEKEWAEMKKKHAVLVEEWEKECTGLIQLGTSKKDLSSKLKLGRKPQLPAIDDKEDDIEEDEIDLPMASGIYKLKSRFYFFALQTRQWKHQNAALLLDIGSSADLV